MITRSSSANHLELDSEDAVELLRIAQFFRVDAMGICKVSVTFIREGLTDESCYEKFTREARAALADRDAQLDWTQP